MRSPVRALIWEQWRQVWWTVPLSFLVTLSVSVALHFDRDIGWYIDLWVIGSTGTVLGALLLAGGLLLFLHSNPTDVRGGIPLRHRTLPVSRTTLALSQFAFRVGFVSLLALLLTSVVSAIDPYYAGYVLPATVLSACAMALGTAAMWTLGTKRVGVAAAVAIALLWLSYVAFVYTERTWPEAAPVIPTTLFVASSFVAIRSGARSERGKSIGPRERAATEPAVSRAQHKSQVAAHAWFDQRRRGPIVWFLASLIAIPAAVPFVEDFWREFRTSTSSLYVLNYGSAPSNNIIARHALEVSMALLWLPPVIAFASSVSFLMLDIRDGSLRMANFLFTRSVSTLDIVRARYRFAAKEAIRLCLPATALSISFAIIGSQWRDSTYSIPMADYLLTPEYPLAIFLSFAATVLMFFGAIPVLVGAAWVASVGIGLSFFVDVEFIFWVVPAALAAVALYRAEKVHLIGLMNPRAVVVLLFGTVAVWGGVLVLGSNIIARYDEVAFVATCVGALFLYVVFSQPLWIDFLRHGGYSRIGRRQPPKEA